MRRDRKAGSGGNLVPLSGGSSRLGSGAHPAGRWSVAARVDVDAEPPASGIVSPSVQSHLAWSLQAEGMRFAIGAEGDEDELAPADESRIVLRYVWRLATEVGRQLGSGSLRALDLEGARAFTRCTVRDGGAVDVRGHRREDAR